MGSSLTCSTEKKERKLSSNLILLDEATNEKRGSNFSEEENRNLCPTQQGSNEEKILKYYCSENHRMAWVVDEVICISCGERYKFGLKCVDVCGKQGYSQCLTCSNFKFFSHRCPDDNTLCYSREKKVCPRCSNEDIGYECNDCKYFVCGACRKPSDKFNKELKKSDIALISRALQYSNEPINSLIKLNEKAIASASDDNFIAVVDLIEMQLSNNSSGVRKVRCLNDSKVTITQLAKVGEVIITGDSLGFLGLWKESSFKHLVAFLAHSNQISCIIALHSSFFASSSWDKTIKIWDYKSILERDISSSLSSSPELPNSYLYCIQEQFGYVSQMILLTSLSQTTIATCSWDSSIKLWNLELGASSVKRLVDTKTLKESSIYFNCICEVDNLIAVGCESGEIKVYRVDEVTGFTNVDSLKGHKSGVNVLKLTKDFLISGGDDGVLMFWQRNLSLRKCIRVIEAHSSPVKDVLLLSDNNLVTAGEDGFIKVWSY